MNPSTQAINPLRQRMIDDMRMRKLGAKTQSTYIRLVRQFAGFLQRSPDTASAEDLRRFQLHLAEQGASAPYRRDDIEGACFVVIEHAAGRQADIPHEL